MSMTPVALYGLEVPPLGVMVPAMQEDSLPNACYRITMAALDPTEPPEPDEDGNVPSVPRSTLKLIRKRASLDGGIDDDYLQQLIAGGDDEDSDEEEDDDEPNGGPSDKAKSKKAKPKVAAKSVVILDIKPWDDETDMVALEAAVRGIEKDGLVWGASKLVPVGFGIKKLQINLVIEDEKISLSELEEEIQEFEDYVQSTDVATMQKL
ncbi:hypothetical protein NUW58_g10825 [Xylaria curta]|uniref:Uncharacterized protein n=1 Tax=Xylaria curta TaxID=42375 RepID=A0ACC1MFZ4_9PEZI|nr:hypothetical protein NUW58_g10825 [Xylaria curta]